MIDLDETTIMFWSVNDLPKESRPRGYIKDDGGTGMINADFVDKLDALNPKAKGYVPNNGFIYMEMVTQINDMEIHPAILDTGTFYLYFQGHKSQYNYCIDVLPNFYVLDLILKIYNLFVMSVEINSFVQDKRTATIKTLFEAIEAVFHYVQPYKNFISSLTHSYDRHEFFLQNKNLVYNFTWNSSSLMKRKRINND